MGEETRDCVKCPAFDGEDESQVLMSQLKQESNPNQFPIPLHLCVDDLVAFDPCQFPTPSMPSCLGVPQFPHVILWTEGSDFLWSYWSLMTLFLHWTSKTAAYPDINYVDAICLMMLVRCLPSRIHHTSFNRELLWVGGERYRHYESRPIRRKYAFSMLACTHANEQQGKSTKNRTGDFEITARQQTAHTTCTLLPAPIVAMRLWGKIFGECPNKESGYTSTKTYQK